jgi:predicted porin
VLASGVAAASRWGISVREDLGGGLGAGAQLEQGFAVDTGLQRPYQGDPSTATPTAPNGVNLIGFNRRSIVWMQNNLGNLALGRDYTPVFYTVLETDALRLGYLNNLQVLVAPAGGQERYARVSNAVFYTSPDLAGLRVRFAYSLGSESSGAPGTPPRGSNVFAGAGAVYKRGPLSVAGSYQQLDYPTVAGKPAAFTGNIARRTDTALGARYSIGPVDLVGGTLFVGTPQNFRDTWLGARWTSGPGVLMLEAQRLSQDNATCEGCRGTAWALAYAYSMSRRTTLYASWGTTRNSATASFGMAGSDFAVSPAAPGASPSAFALGVKHAF